jgi:hypothetical protein
MSKLANRQITPSRLESTYFPFEGGLNMVDPSLALKPGELVAAENFEIDIRGRYRRVDGYERFDGQTLLYLPRISISKFSAATSSPGLRAREGSTIFKPPSNGKYVDSNLLGVICLLASLLILV